MHPITAIVCVVFLAIIVIRWGRILIQTHRQDKAKRDTKKDIDALMVMLVTTVLFGCNNDEVHKMKDELSQMGLLEAHELRRIEQTHGIDGRISGSSGIFGGSFDGKITSERKLQFYWGRTTDEFISTTLPYSMFRFIIEEGKKTPTVEFGFDEHFLNRTLREPFSESEKANPNDWVGGQYSDFYSKSWRCMTVVVVRISLADFKSGVYFQQ